ncbi:methyltransferase domain protein [Oesophagostomum dentatum]|uniref:Methyltransferase domain protein n=1 Tax=Oesophagostomum dentatum TaxID=61180 RepID=A0A0B1T5Z8_OESDE|nr:methyltransferase domain protein [Oesophagostomum dentatum]
MISACIALGNRLHLFDALAKVGSEEKPATAAQVAEESGCKERYVREWLAVMATSDIISVTEDEKFFIKKEHIEDLTSSTGVVSHSFLPAFLKPYEKVCSVFKKDGPYGIHHTDIAPEFHDIMAKFSEARHKKYFITDFVPALGADIKASFGIENRNRSTFPKSHFTGIDISPEAIKLAKELEKDDGKKYENLSFFEMDAMKLDPAWTNKFDLVTNINACHGQMRPDLGLKEIHRVLKPGGVLGMLEIYGTSNIYKDKHELGEQAAIRYARSIFGCLPLGSNSKDALGLGTMWGIERAKKLLKEAGFDDVKLVPTPHFEANILYICKK